MERDQRKDSVTVSMDDIDNYSVWCVMHNKEIFINDNLNEYHKYTKNSCSIREMPSSLLFCPLTVGDKVTGVITVQSFQKRLCAVTHGCFKNFELIPIVLENANLVETLLKKKSKRTNIRSC